MSENEARGTAWRKLGHVCLTCRFWLPQTGGEPDEQSGLCVCKPPTAESISDLTSDDVRFGYFPTTFGNEGCGEHWFTSTPKEGSIPEVRVYLGPRK